MSFAELSATASPSSASVVAAVRCTKGLDLRHAAVAIDELDRHRAGLRGEPADAPAATIQVRYVDASRRDAGSVPDQGSIRRPANSIAGLGVRLRVRDKGSDPVQSGAGTGSGPHALRPNSSAFTKNIKVLRLFPRCSIDFGGFLPMFAVDAARRRIRFLSAALSA